MQLGSFRPWGRKFVDNPNGFSTKSGFWSGFVVRIRLHGLVISLTKFARDEISSNEMQHFVNEIRPETSLTPKKYENCNFRWFY